MVEHRPGVTGAAIQEHEEAAELSFILIEILGALTLGGAIWERLKKKALPFFWAFLLLFGVVNFALLLRTSHLGGLIRHQELIGQVPATENSHSESSEKDDH